jgi:hypothetical protein
MTKQFMIASMEAENTSTKTEAIPKEHTKIIYIRINLQLENTKAKAILF